MLNRATVQEAVEAGKGVLRLEPCWVPRSFMIPGRQLKLHPDDLYAFGAHRGGINERWFASTTKASNGLATTPDEAHEIMRGVPEDRAKRDLHAAFEFLASRPDVKKDRIGAIGWCMGGGYSLDVALQEPTLAADVINYGHLATDPDALKKINAPILGSFGGQDRGITDRSEHDR